MYEKFKNQFISKLAEIYSVEEIRNICKYLDLAAYDYEFTEKCTDVVIYNSEMPEMVKTFLVCKKIEGLAEGTLYNYGITLKSFFIKIQKLPQNVVPNDIRVYLFMYQKERNISNRSLDKIRQTFSSFFTWANTEGYIDSNPSTPIKQIKYTEKPRIALSQLDLEYLRATCKTLKEKAMIEFMYSTGCRVSEMAGAKKSDIDWDKRTILLFGKGSKYRVTYINAKAEVALKAYLDSRVDNTDSLFVSDRAPYNQMHNSGIQKIIRLIAERASDTVNKHVTPHIFRHTTATTCINRGMPIEDVSKLLGHSNISTTMIYSHVTEESVQDGHRKCIV